MAKNAMPKSKAKTAYGLLSEIRKLILEEPKRYDQVSWLRTGRDVKAVYGDGAPSCGTVGCVAGWVVALKGGKNDRVNVMGGARRILGIDGSYWNGQVGELFRGGKVPARDAVGVMRHAKLGAAHIARFQKKYATELKAKRV